MKTVKKKIDIYEIIIACLYLMLGLSFLIFNETTLSNYNYILVIIFLLIGVIGIINNKERNKVILSMVSIWMALFIYLYYYETILILFLPVALSIYGLVISLLYLGKNKLNFIVSLIISCLLILHPIFDVIIFIKLFGLYILYLLTYSIFIKRTH